MKRMIFLILFTPVFFGIAKAGDYEKTAQAIREEIWNWDVPAFKNYVVPEKYDTCSAVVLARRQEIIAGAKKKLRFDPVLLLAQNAELKYTYTDRVLIKINDKKTLEYYSELEFQQLKKFHGYRIRNTFTSVIGARVIKPDGSISEVDASQSVTLADEKFDKRRKLSIPNLQIGDILDYFYCDEYKLDNQDIDPFLFSFSFETPILNYSIHCEFGKGIDAEYRVYNGAPDFIAAVDEETGNQVLDLEVEDLETSSKDFWTSFIRSSPAIRLKMIYADNKSVFRPERTANLPRLLKNPPVWQIIKDARWSASIEAYGANYSRYGVLLFGKEIRKLTENYKRNHPNATPDDISAFIFYAHRYYMYNSIGKKSSMGPDRNRNITRFDERRYIVALERYIHFLNENGNYGLGFVSNKDGARFDEMFTRYDMNFVLVNLSDSGKVLACSSPFTNAWYVPVDNDGESATLILVDNYGSAIKGDTKVLSRKDVNLPESGWKDNQYILSQTVDIDDSFSSLVIDRKVQATGHFKEFYQQLLLLFEDYDAEERRYLGIEKTIWEEMEDDKKLRKLIPDYKAAFEKARKEQKDGFKKEVELFYDSPVKEVVDYEIINSGIFHENPEFIFRSKYTKDDLIKRAGNDYVLDVGKLIGSQLHLNEQQRNRKQDISMPFARTFEYNLVIQIPEGYTVKNIENLDMEVDNDCGQFISKASLDGKNVSIRVSKIFKKAQLPVEEWPQLLEILDAANDFVGKSVIFAVAKFNLYG
ncbi:MAG: DUF3857 domain-containing protein [Dysgonamonadaceae bacterium]|jgi:hypothetical protein|nr:DUF3857 domain-containing protein [Dysgonamonadaceae bacterium]